MLQAELQLPLGMIERGQQPLAEKAGAAGDEDPRFAAQLLEIGRAPRSQHVVRDRARAAPKRVVLRFAPASTSANTPW